MCSYCLNPLDQNTLVYQDYHPNYSIAGNNVNGISFHVVRIKKLKIKWFVADSVALWGSGGCYCQLGRNWMGTERNEKGGTSTVCMSHHLLPPPTPRATHTPTSQTAYFVLQVRDLLSNIFMAGKIYFCIKLDAGAALTTQTQQANDCESRGESNCRYDAEEVQTL